MIDTELQFELTCKDCPWEITAGSAGGAEDLAASHINDSVLIKHPKYGDNWEHPNRHHTVKITTATLISASRR